MISRRSWLIARRYVLVPLSLGIVLLSRGRRSGLLALGAAGAILMFFRDPERPLDPDPDVVYAAADGFVTDVEEAHEPWIPGGDALRISTFLSIHNVHVNRSPVEGSVTKMEEIAGKFVPAFLGSSKDQNHQNRIAIDGPKGRAVVVQIAGMVARKISRWIETGERIAAGQRIGLIHFGSRTDVLLPVGSADPLVRPGDRVRAGATPLARYRKEEGII
ncbi:MAG: phosphatidylserine decarboxylase family protein [Rubrobacter sp.]|nr:phosphatidylserine decarboxylase family protein [Rubrobacter sp.]